MNKIWDKLSIEAWKVRENAFIYGKTKVGCSLKSTNGKIFAGVNIEQLFRSHDIHAEVNAISNMVTSGEIKFTHLLIVAERERFTPCGACMDWIMQFGGDSCLVGFQSVRNGIILIKTSGELMPYYPN